MFNTVIVTTSTGNKFSLLAWATATVAQLSEQVRRALPDSTAPWCYVVKGKPVARSDPRLVTDVALRVASRQYVIGLTPLPDAWQATTAPPPCGRSAGAQTSGTRGLQSPYPPLPRWLALRCLPTSLEPPADT